MKTKRTLLAIPLIAVLLVMILTASLAYADSPVNSSALRNAVTKDEILQHMLYLQNNIGPHPSGSSAHLAASEYVLKQLATAGYAVQYQNFSFSLWQETATPVLEKTAPTFVSYPAEPTSNLDWGFATMEYSGSGDVTASVLSAANYGCAAADFSAGFTNKIALVLRGVCNFSDKVVNAHNAGAVGVIIYNDLARHEFFYGTLASVVADIPSVGASWAVGQDLLGTGVVAHLKVSTQVSTVNTRNVLADTPGGRDDRMVVVGAHLDTVPEGPGTNDNGSGAMTILEIAEQMSKLGIKPVNKVRFAFWSGEEQGLLGAQYYVDSLTARDRKNTAVNLDFDMIASSNYAVFVYDGDGSPLAPAGPNGSGNVEKVFLDYFASQNLHTFPTAFDGRSDYGPFIAVGIPAGGVFAGADDKKTAEEYQYYGGTVGEYLDPYYHTAADTDANVNQKALDTMSDAMADAVLQFAMTGSAVNGTGKSSSVPKSSMEYWGNSLTK